MVSAVSSFAKDIAGNGEKLSRQFACGETGGTFTITVSAASGGNYSGGSDVTYSVAMNRVIRRTGTGMIQIGRVIGNAGGSAMSNNHARAVGLAMYDGAGSETVMKISNVSA